MHLSLLIFVPMLKCRVKVAPDLSNYEKIVRHPKRKINGCMLYLKILVMVMNTIVCKQNSKNIVMLNK